MFIETIFIATAQKREHQQLKQKSVSEVRSPNGLFMMSATAAPLFRQFSANLQFHFCFTLIFNNQRSNIKKEEEHKK